jgi:gliding motility-associated-like protein
MRFLLFCSCLFFLLFGELVCHGQTCKGSLGDPIFTETFGAGTNPGPALPTSVTTYNYNPSGCPNDGDYSILNSISPSCHSSWHALPHDHTGNPNGYMMLVNASYGPGVFYTQHAPVLCNSTTYEFSAYIINLVTPEAEAGSPILPNITFVAETVDGAVLGTSSTGDIHTTSDINGWVKYAVTFQAPANNAPVVVKMINNAPGGYGNDLVIDDIAFRACGPILQAGFNTSLNTADQTLCSGDNANYALSASIEPGFENYSYQWQVNRNGTGWQDISGFTNSSCNVSITNAQIGTYRYRVAAALPANMSSATCRVYSDSVTVNVIQSPVANAGPDKYVFEGDSVRLAAIASPGKVSYQWTPPDYLDDPTVLNPVATPVNDITYTLHVLSEAGCTTATDDVFIKVYRKVIVPNTFSPNNDGVNDTWAIKGLESYPAAVVQVFNRYGLMVFQNIGYSRPWDGTVNGHQLAVGTYYYLIDLKVNNLKKAGWITIIR